MSSESVARAFPFPLSGFFSSSSSVWGGLFEVKGEGDRMKGTSWTSDPSIEVIAWPPELSADSKIEDNEGTLSQLAGNA